MAQISKRAKTLAESQAEGLETRSRDVARYARDEAGAVAQTAREHPTAAAGTLLVIAALAFTAGFLMGSSSAQPRYQRFW